MFLIIFSALLKKAGLIQCLRKIVSLIEGGKNYAKEKGFARVFSSIKLFNDIDLIKYFIGMI